jgi:anthranilate synthase/aminodeoxychorismate synthase-like glutamine amidotransferase
MIVMIDNFDSFTYNLVQAVESMGEEVVVFRNNAVTLSEIDRLNPDGILISPGPGSPQSAGISLDVIKHFHEKKPILGVCLGHQCIAEAFGGKILHASRVMHGKFSQINHDGTGIFSGLPRFFSAVRYHSLAMDRDIIPKDLHVCATADDDEVMGLRHEKYRVYGVQFHPESIATEYGCEIIQAFITRTKEVI